MLRTFEAIVDEQGKIYPLEFVRLSVPHRALVTILRLEETLNSNETKPSLDALGEVLDDLESASREIAEMFNQAIERAGREVQEE